MTITAVLQIGAGGWDALYIHGAEIAEPYSSPSVTWDESVEPPKPVFVIGEIARGEDEQHYIDALAEYGLTVIGDDPGGDPDTWLVEQSRPLREGVG